MLNLTYRLALSFALIAAALPASASFHIMMVREVFTGSTAAPDAQYIMLQMYSTGQNQVAGHSVTAYDINGNEVGSFTFSSNVANGANQATILLATTEAETLFGISADQAMTAVLDPSGGKVCFEDIDCVSWGNFQGSAFSPSPSGTPFGPNGGILIGHAIRRDISHGNSSTLQGGDDSDDSFEDFDCVDTAEPIANDGSSGTYTDAVPCPVCGNDTTEIGEICDGSDDMACPGGCLEDCRCPVHDAVVLPIKPLKIKIGVDKVSVSKKVKIKVVNGDTHKGNDDIRLVGDIGDCPVGVSFTTPDFNPPNLDDTTKVDVGRAARATVIVTVTADAFATFNRKTPKRCTMTFTAQTDILGNTDPRPSNDSAPLEINVFDKNDPEQDSPPDHETVFDSMRALKLNIRSGHLEGLKKARPGVINGDILPDPDVGDVIDVAVDVSSCTGVSVVALDMAKKVDGLQSSVAVDGGKKVKGALILSADPAQISTPNKKSPERCIATLTATGPSTPDPDPSNNVGQLVIDIVDKNDLP